MNQHAAPAEFHSPARVSRRGFFVELGVVFVSLALFAALRSPLPGVNEPHYLCKAKHLWDPAWCGRDLFLQSADAHALFLTLIGAVTRVLSLEATAWVGRVAVWLALAWGWTRLVAELIPAARSATRAAWAYLALAAVGSFSGEWLVGGVEAKGFAYACVFLSFAAACRNEATRAGVFAGLAVSLHPVIGAWSIAAIAFACLTGPTFRRTIFQIVRDLRRDFRTIWKIVLRKYSAQFAGPILAFALCAAPGLIPVVIMLAAASPEETHQADEIQVFLRLSHHLNPEKFPTRSYVEYGVLLVAWLAACGFATPDRAGSLFRRYVLGTVLIAAVGLIIGWGPQTAGLMKFYPFRLFDVMLPVAAAVTLVAFAALDVGQPFQADGVNGARRFAASRQAGKPDLRELIVVCVFLGLFAFAMFAPATVRDSSVLSPPRQADWRDVCRWIEGNTPPDALFLTPRYNFGFKWHAQRAEYVAYKDCPQDARSLVEWKRRLDAVQDWRLAHAGMGFTPAAVAELQRATDIDYIVAWTKTVLDQRTNNSYDPFTADPVFQNASFAVYDVRPR